MARPFMMGAVAYSPKVVTIWEGFKEYFRRHNFEFDYILYSNYERQVEAQLNGSCLEFTSGMGQGGSDGTYP